MKKEDLNPDEEERVKKVAQQLLETLKREKLVLDWKKKQQTRADVKITIQDLLYSDLPEHYSKEECDRKSERVYMHVYDSYVDEKQSVYA